MTTARKRPSPTHNAFDVYDVDTASTTVKVAETFLFRTDSGSELAVTATEHDFTVRIEDVAVMMTREEGEALHAALACALGLTDYPVEATS